MLKSIFGDNQILIFAVAFVGVLALIGIMALLFRRFGSGRLPSSGGGRGRQPRLGVLDSAAVDAKRRLVLIRRDNAEHLIMIGGPTDVVVETNIVRGGAAAMPQPERRPMPQARMQAVEPELPEPSLVPEPDMIQEPAPRPQPAAYSPPPPMPQRAAPPAPMAPPPPRPMAPPPAAASPLPPAPAPMAPPPMVPAAPGAQQQKLDPQYADMAQRLEAALRKPATPPSTPAPQPAPTQVIPPVVAPASPAPAPTKPMMPQAGSPRPPAAPARPMPPAPRPATAAPAPAGSGNDNVFDSLEAEMASLLGQDGKKN